MEENKNAAEGKKKKFVITDKMVYIAAAVVFCVLFAFSLLVPRILKRFMYNTFGVSAESLNLMENYTRRMSEENAAAFGAAVEEMNRNFARDAEETEREMPEIMPEEIKEMNFSANEENAAAFRAVIEKMDENYLSAAEKMEREMLEIMPEEIKNMKFSGNKEKAKFFRKLADATTTQEAYSGAISPRQLNAAKILAYIYSAREYFKQIQQDAGK